MPRMTAPPPVFDAPQSARAVTFLPSLELGRFVAATLVMFFHFSFAVQNRFGVAPLSMMFRAGHSGVEYFFVLSGFIILHVHRVDLGRPDRIGRFFAKRAIRILPMLWLTVGLWGILRMAVPGETTRDATTVTGLLLDMLLVPHAGDLVLGVTWTLQRELVFYLLFALCIWRRVPGMLVLAAWQGAIIVGLCAGLSYSPLPEAIFGASNLGFGAGMLIAVLHWPRTRRGIVASIATGIAAYVGLMAWEWVVGRNAPVEVTPLPYSPVLFVAAATPIVAGLVALDQRRGRSSGARDTGHMRWAALLGGSSYVLYIIHGPVGSIAERGLARLHIASPDLIFALLCGIAVASAIALHLLVERPIIARLQRLVPARRR